MIWGRCCIQLCMGTSMKQYQLYMPIMHKASLTFIYNIIAIFV